MSTPDPSSPARKRTREDESGAGATQPSMVRSPDFYFNDGTIALRALSKQDMSYIIFRVHKSLLALRCSVFHDMFGDEDTVHLAAASKYYDGVPLMHLHDHPNEIVDFLRALYDPEFMHHHLDYKRCYMSSFPELYSRAMPLAKKYGAQQLVDMFTRALEREWPSNWKVASAVLRSRQAIEDILNEERPDDGNHEIHVQPDPAWTIRMAIDLDIPNVLPYAFATLCVRLGPDFGASTETGEPWMPNTQDGVRVLDADELIHLIIGGRTLASYVLEFASEHPTPPSDMFGFPLSESHDCYESFVVAWAKTKVDLRKVYGSSHPFCILRDALANCDLCDSCRMDAQDRIYERELDIWQKLPKFFDLHRFGVSGDWGH